MRWALSNWTGVLLAVILVVGCWLRCANLNDSLWLDELHTDWATAGNSASVSDRAAQGNQPPVYFWLIWLVRRVADSEAALRTPSLVASCLLPLAMAHLIRTLHFERKLDAVACLLAAWWWATDDVAIFFGQEARPYAIVQLVALLQLAAGWRVVTDPARATRWLFWALSLLLIYTHYTAGLLLLGELAAYCVWLLSADYISAPAYRGKQLLVDAILFCLLLTPAALQVRPIFEHRHDWQQFVTLPSLTEVLRLYPALTVAPAFLLARRKTLSQLLLARSFLMPLMLAMVLTMTGVLPLFFPRYLAALLPLGWLLIGYLPSRVQNLHARWALVAILAFIPIATNSHLRTALQSGEPVSEHDEDWRGAAAYLRQQVTTAEQAPLLLLAPRLIEGQRLTADSSERFRYYLLFPVSARYDFGITPESTVPLPGPPLSFASREDRQRLRKHEEAWVLARIAEDQIPAVQTRLSEEFLAQGLDVNQDDVHSFGGVQLWRFRIQPIKPVPHP